MAGGKDKKHKGPDDEPDTEPEEQSWWKSLFNSINPFTDSEGNFSFGIIGMLLVAAVGYFIFANDSAKEKLGGMWDKVKAWVAGTFPSVAQTFGWDNAAGEVLDKMTVEDAREDLKGHVSDAQLAALTKDETTWNSFKQTIKEANGGKIPGLNDVMNDKSLVALITSKKPEVQTMVGSLLAGMKSADPKATLSDEEKKQRAPIFAALQKVVQGPGLTTLLSQENRPTTLAALNQFMPGFDVLLNNRDLQLLDDKGAPTQKLRTVLTKALTPNETTGQLNIDEALNELTTDDTGKTDPKKLKAIIDASLPKLKPLLGSDQNIALFRTCFGDEAILDIGKRVEQNPSYPIADYMLESSARFKSVINFANQADIAALPADIQEKVQLLKSLPPAAIEPLCKIMDAGINPLAIRERFVSYDTAGKELPIALPDMVDGFLNSDTRKQFREIIAKAGPDCLPQLLAAFYPEQKEMFTAGNVKILLDVADKIARDPDNQQNEFRTKKVLNYMIASAMGKLEYFAKLDPKTEIAPFFKNPANYVAFRALIDDLVVAGPGAKFFAALRADFGTPSEGIAEMLADPAGAAFIQEKLTKPGKSYPDWMSRIGLAFEDKVISENADFILDFKHRLEVKEVKPAEVSGPSYAALASPSAANRLAF